MKSLSINIVLLVVLWALIGIWHPATQAATWGRPAWLSLINHFLNFSCWLWKVYVPQKKDLHNDIAYLHIDFPDGGLLNSKRGLQSIVSCSIGKLIQKYCTWWKFVSLFVCLFCKECHSCMYRFKLLWLHTIQKHALLDLPLHCLHFQYFPPLLHTWFLANSGISRSLQARLQYRFVLPALGCQVLTMTLLPALIHPHFQLLAAKTHELKWHF